MSLSPPIATLVPIRVNKALLTSISLTRHYKFDSVEHRDKWALRQMDQWTTLRLSWSFVGNFMERSDSWNWKLHCQHCIALATKVPGNWTTLVPVEGTISVYMYIYCKVLLCSLCNLNPIHVESKPFQMNWKGLDSSASRRSLWEPFLLPLTEQAVAAVCFLFCVWALRWRHQIWQWKKSKFLTVILSLLLPSMKINS